MLFLDLPLEILPEILSHIVKTQHLASLCLVNSAFRTFAVSQLYEKVSIYSWHKEGKTKVIKLFDTLSRYPYLALLVFRLEIRDFPRAVIYLDDNILRHVLSGLKNCVNLRSCTWTREGSLNSAILEALLQCKNLRELELNGHNIGNYDPRLLLGFTELHRISLIMPTIPVVSQLIPWLSATGATLRSLTLLCKASSILTDRILEAIAPSLVNLEYLNLTGCPKVTNHGVWAIVSSSTKGILELGLEGVSSKFDIATFANECISSGALRRLRSITLTTYFQVSLLAWVKHVVHLLSASPLECFQIYSAGALLDSPIIDELWSQLIAAHGKRLLRISIHRMLISWEAIHSICVQCTGLEQLFLVVDPDFLDQLGPCLSFAKALRTIHINYPMESFVSTFPVIPPSQALSIINQCSPTVTQFGCNARVWQVARTIQVNEDGSTQAHRTLVPYESPDVPEQFLVVRT
ncbi:hypothetical protein BYT27DRAFT_7184152 [Phlegmacium glaucopus]|nr:hypothetical protein BYT27DRAFT_7184152 [Phlegmacium glaucopus]